MPPKDVRGLEGKKINLDIAVARATQGWARARGEKDKPRHRRCCRRAEDVRGLEGKKINLVIAVARVG